MIKLSNNTIAPSGYVGILGYDAITSIAIDSASEMVSAEGVASMNMACDMLVASMGCVEITKEEFYNLE